MEADWLGLKDAIETVMEAAAPLGTEACLLVDGLGRTLAEDVLSPIDLPLWANSGMDGFAVRSVEINGASESDPVTLPVSQDIGAGRFPSGALAIGTAARVMTGAPVPEGADSVVRVEDTDGGREAPGPAATVTIHRDRDAGRNIRHSGEEIGRGDVALRTGTVLDPGALGVAASVGARELTVYRRPVVALLTSGDELVDVDDFAEVLAGRRIVSSNSYTLAAQLREANCEVRHLGIAADSPESLRTAILEAEGCDALITSAGISVGEHDHVRQVLLELGTRIRFWRVRIRPGSPFAFGTVAKLGGVPWFGLPGNPVSSMVTFELFARPALLKMGGSLSPFRRTLRARLLDDHPSAEGLTHLLRVRFEDDSRDELRARLTGAQGSGILRSMAGVDGLLVIPEGAPGARSGVIYEVIPLSAAWGTAGPGFLPRG